MNELWNQTMLTYAGMTRNVRLTASVNQRNFGFTISNKRTNPIELLGVAFLCSQN